jgi:hypothetical protein
MGTQMAKLAATLEGIPLLEKDCREASNVDLIFSYFRSVGATFVALYHRNETAGKDVLLVETGNGDSSSLVISPSDAANNECLKFGREMRDAVQAKDAQDILVALVWITPVGLQYFRAFPELLMGDGTHKTTVEDWELQVLSVKDMNGKQEVVIRCWAPHHRAWMYRWFYQTAVPTLVGKDTCQRVRLVLTDGDSNECTQLADAIRSTFTDTSRLYDVVPSIE